LGENWILQIFGDVRIMQCVSFVSTTPQTIYADTSHCYESRLTKLVQ